jgi:hypothetical protein
MSKRSPNHLVYTERIVIRALHSFYIFIYFTQGLSDGNACPLLGGPSPDVATWAFGTGSSPDEDDGGPIVSLHRHSRPQPLT